MEDDDEFGDLYSDVLPTVTPPLPPPPPASRPIDPNNTISTAGIIVKGEDHAPEVNEIVANDVDDNFGIEEGVEMEIPGLWTSKRKVNNVWEDEDSDSEDDLQIVLNDDNVVNNGIGIMEDESEGNLVILGDTDVPNGIRVVKDGGGMEEGGDLGEEGNVNVLKVAFSGFHHQQTFHSQFKYVRPGAAPIPGAASLAPGGAPGQVHAPSTMPPFSGHWRPASIQKNFQPGQGMPRGLDFTLPSHKTIFEVDVDGFEEKPWRLQGIDVSGFFDFGLDEESWKDYCKQLDQSRMEATMQSKIRVYESGRKEKQYDPDLPPELAAAATGINDTIFENQNIRNTDVHSDLANGSTRGQMQLPFGRAIPVETGFGERIPSIDARPPRPRDLDAIIEIVLQGSAADESGPENDIADDDLSRVIPAKKPEDEEDDVSVGDHTDRHPQPYKGRKREVEPRKKLDSPDYRNERRTKRRTPDRSPHLAHDGSIQDKEFADNQKEGSPENVEGKQSSSISRLSHGSQDFSQSDAIEDEVVRDDIPLDTTTTTTSKDEKRTRTIKNPTLTSRSTRLSAEKYDNGEAPKATRSRNYDERQESEGHRKWSSNSAYHPNIESIHRRKGRESEGAWQDEDLHLHDGRMRSETARKRERVEEIPSRHLHKIRKNERSDKDRHYYKEVPENGYWKGDSERDMVSQQTRHDGSGIHDKRRNESIENQRERNEWKERGVRLERAVEDKTWNSRSRLKEDYRSAKIVEGREKPSTGDRFGNECLLRHTRREVEERRSRHERGNTSDHDFSATDMHRVHEKTHKDSMKKSKYLDGVSHSSLASSRRNREDHSIHRSERVMLEQENGGQNRHNRQSSRKHKEDIPSEDERKDSKRGRSKLERWTSHKDIDLSAGIVNSSASGNVEDTDRYTDNKPIEQVDQSFKPQAILEDTDLNSKAFVEENDDAKPGEEGKLLDTVEKLKKRSERFNLPMPVENESLPLAQGGTQPDPGVKPERPPRKRRWTSG